MFFPTNLGAYAYLPSQTVLPAAPATASKGNQQSCHNLAWPGKGLGARAQTASYSSNRLGCSTHYPFLCQNHPWLKSILPAAEIRKAPGHTGKDSEEKLRTSNAVEEETSLWEDIDHKNLPRVCHFTADWCLLQPARKSLAQDPDHAPSSRQPAVTDRGSGTFGN